MKQIHVKTRLITFVSTCRPRIVAHSATRGFQDTVIGAATLTKGGANGNSTSNNSEREALIEDIVVS